MAEQWNMTVQTSVLDRSNSLVWRRFSGPLLCAMEVHGTWNLNVYLFHVLSSSDRCTSRASASSSASGVDVVMQ
jgi:hypothetical protein